MVMTLVFTSLPLEALAATADIRQEINILDSYLVATANTVATSSEVVLFDSTKYSGTPTYYFEIVASYICQFFKYCFTPAKGDWHGRLYYYDTYLNHGLHTHSFFSVHTSCRTDRVCDQDQLISKRYYGGTLRAYCCSSAFCRRCQ